jgi:hypothetical protein
MRATAEGVRHIERKCFAMAVAAGVKLQQVKEQLPHGTFLRWLAAEQINARSAQNYMNAARVYGGGEYETVSNFPHRVLYRVAAPSVPPELRERLIADIRAGAHPSTIEQHLRAEKARRLDRLSE